MVLVKGLWLLEGMYQELTPSHTVFLEKFMVIWLVKENPVFMLTQRFIIMFKKACH